VPWWRATIRQPAPICWRVFCMKNLTRVVLVVSLILHELLCSLAVRDDLKTIPLQLHSSLPALFAMPIRRTYANNMYTPIFGTGNSLMLILMAQNIYVRKRIAPQYLGLGDCTYSQKRDTDFLTGNRHPLLFLSLFSSFSSSHICWVEAWRDRRACMGIIRAGAQLVRQGKSGQRPVCAETDRSFSSFLAHLYSMRSARVVQELLCAVYIGRSSLAHDTERLR
jgi:hypothetical protein